VIRSTDGSFAMFSVTIDSSRGALHNSAGASHRRNVRIIPGTR
jgi:hypothetical protein